MDNNDLQFEFVPRFYRMNPNEEDLLAKGSLLEEGMVVLVEADTYRATNPNTGPESFSTALKYNRWATVSELEVTEDRVCFIAIYQDGTKQKMNHPIVDAWFVKLKNNL